MHPHQNRHHHTGVEVLTVDRAGSDFMVDVIKSLGFEYLAANSRIEFPRIT